jgi:endonuclease III related protein
MRFDSKKKIYQLYLSLCKKYGEPEEFWKEWCGKKDIKVREKIALGAILTQRTSWQNAELALRNLKKAMALSIEGVYQAGGRNPELLEELIRPSGFYKQKAKRLYQFCEFIIKNYGALSKFFRQDLEVCRNQLLEIPGIGPETADSILLYAGDKLIFVIDEYTRRFARKHNISNEFSYDYLQDLFQKSLPKDIKIYQDFHAIIVLEGKGTGWDLQNPIEQKSLKIRKN